MSVAQHFTCITCHVAFKNADIQRQHYKTDWHRYNLKRKVAELPPVTAESFQEKVLLQRAQVTADSQATTYYCKQCRKSFGHEKAYNNHLLSKKHSENLLFDTEIGKMGNGDGKVTTDDEDMDISKPVEKHQKERVSFQNVNITETTDSDNASEEVDSDEWEDEGKPISITDCLFCSHHSASIEKNFKHMSMTHSFFIPDIEYVTDPEGLLEYLGEKVGQGYICLWCNDRGRRFYSLDAVRNHMIDKGHCKVLHEGAALAEYTDFYNYSTSYPDVEDMPDPDEEVSVDEINGTDYQLVLPSGTVIGHRSLFRYYRQRLHPDRALQPHRQKTLHNLMSQYKALGWTGSTGEAAVRKARDMHYLRRMKDKYNLKLCVKANKHQKYFRQQVQF